VFDLPYKTNNINHMKKFRCNYKNDLQQLNAWEEFKHEIKGKHENKRAANTIKEILDMAKRSNITSEDMLCIAFAWKLSRNGHKYWRNIYDVLHDKYNPNDIQ
jgi:hypothetical protein